MSKESYFMKDLVENALFILAPGVLIIVSSYLLMKNMSKNLEKTLRAEILRQNNKDFAKLKLSAYERLALLLERTSIPTLIQKHAGSAATAPQVRKLMAHAINEEFNYNLSQQVFVSPQTWGTIKVIKEQTLILIQKVERSMPPETSSAEFCAKLIEAMKSNGEIPHEKGLNMIRSEMEILFS